MVEAGENEYLFHRIFYFKLLTIIEKQLRYACVPKKLKSAYERKLYNN